MPHKNLLLSSVIKYQQIFIATCVTKMSKHAAFSLLCFSVFYTFSPSFEQLVNTLPHPFRCEPFIKPFFHIFVRIEALLSKYVTHRSKRRGRVLVLLEIQNPNSVFRIDLSIAVISSFIKNSTSSSMLSLSESNSSVSISKTNTKTVIFLLLSSYLINAYNIYIDFCIINHMYVTNIFSK